MACAKKISKVCLLLLTSSLTHVGFASSTSGGNDPFGLDRTNNLKSNNMPAALYATQNDYNQLFVNLNYVVSTTPMLTVAESVFYHFILFFGIYQNEDLSLCEKGYENWASLNAIPSEGIGTPIWKESLTDFISHFFSHKEYTQDGLRIYTPAQSTLNPVAFDCVPTTDTAARTMALIGEPPALTTTPLDLYIPPHQRKQGAKKLIDSKPLKTPRGRAPTQEKPWKKICIEDQAPLPKTSVFTSGAPLLITDAVSSQSTPPEAIKNIFHFPSSSDISAYLKRYIIGQDKAMSSLATHFYKHFAGLELNKFIKDNSTVAAKEGLVPIDKSNMLLIGQSGCGKTAALEFARDYLTSQNIDVKLIMGNASSLTRTGYVGPSVSSLIRKALIAHDFNIQDTQDKTIIFIDELDKLAAKSETTGRDIAGADVQAELLRVMQGDDVVIEIENESGSKKKYVVNTTNILFIAAGAFSGMKPTMHYMSDTSDGSTTSPAEKQKYFSITTSSLEQFGLKTELIGRLHKRILFNPLEVSDLKRILINSENSVIKQFKSLFASEAYKIDLNFTPESLDVIAEKASKSQTGARSLRSIVEELLDPTLENAAFFKGKTLLVTHEMVAARLPEPEKSEEEIAQLKEVERKKAEEDKKNKEVEEKMKEEARKAKYILETMYI